MCTTGYAAQAIIYCRISWLHNQEGWRSPNMGV